MEKILITGGKGFFCSRFTNYYKDKYEILSLGREELDITDSKNVNNTIKEFKPNIVIHAAAIAETDFCNKNPEIAHKINVEGAINVAKACKEVGSKLVFISSEQVFNGNIEEGPYNEEHKPKPNTVYGQNKLEAEEKLKNILDELWIVRFTWLFGLPERNCGMASNILWDTVESIYKNKKIVAPTNEFRGMTYVYEMIQNFESLFKAPFGTYHLGSQNDCDRYEVVEHILKSLGLEERKHEVLIKDNQKYLNNPRDLRLNCDKAKIYNMKFSNTKEAIAKCIKEFKL